MLGELWPSSGIYRELLVDYGRMGSDVKGGEGRFRAAFSAGRASGAAWLHGMRRAESRGGCDSVSTTENTEDTKGAQRMNRLMPSFNTWTLKLISSPTLTRASFMYVNSWAWWIPRTSSTAFNSRMSRSSTSTSTR